MLDPAFNDRRTNPSDCPLPFHFSYAEHQNRSQKKSAHQQTRRRVSFILGPCTCLHRHQHGALRSSTYMTAALITRHIAGEISLGEVYSVTPSRLWHSEVAASIRSSHELTNTHRIGRIITHAGEGASICES